MASAVGFSFFTKPTSATWLTTGDLQSQQNRTTHGLNILFPFAPLPPPPFPIYTDQPPKPNTAACHRKSATQTPTTTNPEIHKEAQIEKPTPKTHVNCFFFFLIFIIIILFPPMSTTQHIRGKPPPPTSAFHSLPCSGSSYFVETRLIGAVKKCLQKPIDRTNENP